MQHPFELPEDATESFVFDQPFGCIKSCDVVGKKCCKKFKKKGKKMCKSCPKR